MKEKKMYRFESTVVTRGHVTHITPRADLASRILCRRLAGVVGCGAPPVVLVAGNSPPEVVGESFRWTNRSGQHIRHPSAYNKVGWSSLVYHHSTRRVVVGRDWRPEV